MNQRLQARELKVQDVRGDGNCMFRAVSLQLQGPLSDHNALRNSVASDMESSHSFLGGLLDVSPDDNKTRMAHTENFRKDGVSVSEDAIMALSEVTHRTIYVHTAFMDNPLEYKPIHRSKCDGEPINIAFFESGHYKAVFKTVPLNDCSPLNA